MTSNSSALDSNRCFHGKNMAYQTSNLAARGKIITIVENTFEREAASTARSCCYCPNFVFLGHYAVGRFADCCAPRAYVSAYTPAALAKARRNDIRLA